MLLKALYNFGDKLEDKVRGKLSHYPIIYAFIGGAGIIIFWRGVWIFIDYLMEYFFAARYGATSSTSSFNILWWDGPLSMLVGAILLLMTGLFVTSFIGNEIIISGLKRGKKMAEKTEEEIEMDLKADIETKHEIHDIDNRLKHIEEELKK